MSDRTDLLAQPGHALDGSQGQREGVDVSAGQSPRLDLDGFSGPLEQMLFLARAQKLDLAKLSLQEFVEQLMGALRREAPINQKAEWVGMATWVILLRSRLLIPVSPAAQQNAEAEAQTLQARLVALQEMQALAAWLSARPQLGQDVFARGAPEMLGALSETDHQLDVIEFLWATIELLDDADDADTEALYRPFYLDIYKVSEARERIFRRVVEAAERQDLQDLVPAASGFDPADAKAVQRYKSGWTTTFSAALEMAKQGEVALVQKGSFEPIAVAKAELALSP
jgi:segregation and condensation protein A